MLFTDVNDFFAKASKLHRLAPIEERDLAQRMLDGDETAKQSILQSHLPLIAAYIRRAPQEIQSLHTVYACIEAVEKGIEGFDFLNSNRPFAYYVSRHLRQCITRCIADR